MIKNISVWNVEAQLSVGLFREQPILFSLPNIYIIADLPEAVNRLLEQSIFKTEDELFHFDTVSIHSLACQVFIPADLEAPDEESNKEVSVNGSTPAKLFKVLVNDRANNEASDQFAIHDSVQQAAALVATHSPDFEVLGVSLLANSVFMDEAYYPTAHEKRQDSVGRPNSLYKLLSKEQQANEILKNQELWAVILKGYGGPMWGGRYIKAYLAAGIKTVGDFALHIMALGLKSVPGQRYGCIFEFAKPTPEGRVVTVNPSDVGHWGWKGALLQLEKRGFSWRDYVINPEDLAFYEETTGGYFSK